MGIVRNNILGIFSRDFIVFWDLALGWKITCAHVCKTSLEAKQRNKFGGKEYCAQIDCKTIRFRNRVDLCEITGGALLLSHLRNEEGTRLYYGMRGGERVGEESNADGGEAIDWGECSEAATGKPADAAGFTWRWHVIAPPSSLLV